MMSSCWALVIKIFSMLVIPSREFEIMWRSSTNMRPVTDLWYLTLDANTPSFESCMDFRRSLMYIMNRMGDNTDPCRNPLWRNPLWR